MDIIARFGLCYNGNAVSRRKKYLSWLPVDSRLFMPLWSFGRVKGIARIFLQIEMILSVAVVAGTLAVVLVTLFLK
jgi:hypothetical protein